MSQEYKDDSTWQLVPIWGCADRKSFISSIDLLNFLSKLLFFISYAAEGRSPLFSVYKYPASGCTLKSVLGHGSRGLPLWQVKVVPPKLLAYSSLGSNYSLFRHIAILCLQTNESKACRYLMNMSASFCCHFNPNFHSSLHSSSDVANLRCFVSKMVEIKSFSFVLSICPLF